MRFDADVVVVVIFVVNLKVIKNETSEYSLKKMREREREQET